MTRLRAKDLAMRLGTLVLAASLGACGTLWPFHPAGAEPGEVRDVYQPVDWEAVKQRAEERRADRAEAPVKALPRRDDHEALRQVRIPVLLPNPPEMPDMVRDMRVFPKPHSYAASLRLPDMLVEVFGTHVAKALPEGAAPPEGAMRMASADYILERTEYGYELSFARWGCSYNIAITCDDPRGNERCRAPAFVTHLADTMDMVGGEPGPAR